MRIEVAGMPRASLYDDGSGVELEFQTTSGPVTLVFAPEALERFASRAVDLVRSAQNHRHAKSGHAVLHASEVTAVRVGAPVDGGRVLLTVRGTNGIDLHFAIPIPLAEQLKPDLWKAVSDATARARATRQ
jgi:hypothetical protein